MNFEVYLIFLIKLFSLRDQIGFRYGKKHFVKIVTSLVTVLLKMALCLCIYFVFTKKPLF